MYNVNKKKRKLQNRYSEQQTDTCLQMKNVQKHTDVLKDRHSCVQKCIPRNQMKLATLVSYLILKR